MMKRMKMSKWMAPTMRNATVMPVKLESQKARANEKYITTAMMMRIKMSAKVAAFSKRTTLSITSSFRYSV